ncbi:MAG: hypothetical protein M3198_10440 [Actinomycetota bacterium]|nr:hypothetical protein [Actinomycetota bacterium]
MGETNGLLRARVDVDEGRLWKARDRLTGLLSRDPADQEVLQLLGEVHFAMRDLPAAGRYWFLTERTGPEVEEALGALKARFPTPQSLGTALPVYASLEAFPKTVRQRVAGEGVIEFLPHRARRPAHWQRPVFTAELLSPQPRAPRYPLGLLLAGAVVILALVAGAPLLLDWPLVGGLGSSLSRGSVEPSG